MFRVLGLVCAVCVVGGSLLAGSPSLLGQVSLQRGPVVDIDRSGPALFPRGSEAGVPQTASLFAGRSVGGLFEPRAPVTGSHKMGAAGLRNLIAEAEAGLAGYDAIHHGARILPQKLPTRLTIAEVRRWARATPGQPHAIGRYQFIPPTFNRLVSELGLKDRQIFSALVQDQMADVLLAEAGLHQYLAGTMGQTTFMNNLAKIWAGLPNDSGQSHYHGYAGNKAVITWDQFRRAMDEIFPRG